MGVKVHINIRLPGQIHAALLVIAERERRDLTNTIEKLIDEALQLRSGSRPDQLALPAAGRKSKLASAPAARRRKTR